MGFWDRKVRDSFEELFDYNRDGLLDPWEESRRIDFLEKSMDSGHSDDAEDEDYDYDEDDEYDDEEHDEYDSDYDEDDDEWYT